jgi:hypothetical protein
MIANHYHGAVRHTVRALQASGHGLGRPGNDGASGETPSAATMIAARDRGQIGIFQTLVRVL